VAETDPAPGRRVKQGRTVRLVLSSGSRYSVVPDVRELSLVEAQEKLVKAGLRVASEQYVYHDIIPYDRVIDVVPATGTRVDRNTAVAITLSEGPKPSEGDFMPDVRSTVVHVILPDDEPEAKIMRIDVWDNAGKHEGVYQEMQEPGKEVTQTVQGSGKMTVEVYYGERLIMTRKL
jgi:hypothetical protein